MANSALNRIEIAYYTVNIGALTGGAAPADGHVDPTKPEAYAVTSAFPSTKENSEAKERANMRWEAIIRSVSTDISPITVTGVEATGATEDAPATQVTFTVAYDRPEYLRTEDELNPGTFFEGADAIKRYVERALIVDHTENRFFYDPTLEAGTVKNGPQILQIVAGKAEAALPIASITVTEVADVTNSI